MGDGLFVHGGVTSAQEARLALAGLIALQGPGALDVRTGVLYGPGTTALVTGTASTAPMQVAIGVHDGVSSRGVANGPYLMPTEAVVLFNIGAAPGSGTRIDVVWERQKDATAGVPTPDGSYGAEYGVLAGTVGAGKPDLATLGPAGALELATVAVSAGAVRTTDGTVTITNTARQTVARGAPTPVRSQAERDALTKYPFLTVDRLDTGDVEMVNLSNAWVTVYDATPVPPVYAQLKQTAATLMTSGGWLSVLMQGEDFDTVNGHSTSANPSRWSPGVKGIFGASGGTSWPTNPTGRRGVRLAKNGVTPVANSASLVPAASGGGTSVPMRTVFFQLDATDYIELQAFQDSGTDLNTSVAASGDEVSSLSVWLVQAL